MYQTIEYASNNYVNFVLLKKKKKKKEKNVIHSTKKIPNMASLCLSFHFPDFQVFTTQPNFPLIKLVLFVLVPVRKCCFPLNPLLLPVYALSSLFPLLQAWRMRGKRSRMEEMSVTTHRCFLPPPHSPHLPHLFPLFICFSFPFFT